MSISIDLDRSTSVGRRMRDNAAQLAAHPTLEDYGPVSQLLGQLRAAPGSDAGSALTVLTQAITRFDHVKTELTSGAHHSADTIDGAIELHRDVDSAGAATIGSLQV